MRKIRQDIIMALVVLAVAVFLIIITTKITGRLRTEEVGPRFTPFLVAIGMASLSFMQLVLSLVKLRKERKKEKEATDLLNKEKPLEKKSGFSYFLFDKYGHLFVWVVMLVCSLAMTQIGFILSAIIIMFVTMYTMCPDGQHNFIAFVVTSIGVPIIVYFVFVRIFFLMLPVGYLWRNLGIL